MIDMRTEELLGMAEASKRLPVRAGKTPHPAMLIRWAKIGVRGVRLEAIRCGASLWTSQEALERFCLALTEPAQPAVVPPSKPSKAALLADARLAELGI
jgi:hypothetical protein